jgi:hypothetical protein
MEEICSDIVGSSTGEMFYKCMSETAGYTHWAGPFFSAMFLGIFGAFIVFAIVDDAR